MKALTLCLLILLPMTAGCATYSQSTVDTLVGKPYREAEVMFGEAPVHHVPLPGGGGIYTWEHVELLTADDWVEVIKVWVDAHGKVTKAQWKKRRP